MNQLIKLPLIILFSGLPGTLKTFISSRIAQRLGCVLLPTAAFGNVIDPNDEALLETQRNNRYALCIEALHTLNLMSTRVVIDGGFLDKELRKKIFKTYASCPKLLIYCHADIETRLSRLRIRSSDTLDIEQASAKSIMNSWGVEKDTNDSFHDSPSSMCCNAIIDVNTSKFEWCIKGEVDKDILEQIDSALKHAFSEYQVTDKFFGNEDLKSNFAELAHCYDETTEWRTDETLLSQLKIDLPGQVADVLDIGSGTGIASHWYTENGHKCVGVDISPQMSIRASSRLLFTNFGSATDLPYFDDSFDLAIMRQVLHYTEPDIVLQETKRILRSKGKLIIASAIAPSTDLKPLWEEFKNVTQPLRLRVFTELELIQLIQANGFNVVEVRHATIQRRESFRRVSKRAQEPASGWLNFMNMMGRIFANSAPEITFKVNDDSYEYEQYWVTLIANKI